MRSPINKDEENIWTGLAEAYLSNREKAYKEELRVYRWFLWLVVAFCASCVFLCFYGGSLFTEWNRNFNGYITHETILSEKRDQRDAMKFIQDSSMQARREAREVKKEIRDSIASERHNKQMDHYESLPDYKSEGK